VLGNIRDSLKTAAPSREGAFARVLDVRGHLPVEVRFFSFDINRVDGVQAEPCGEGKSILVRPLCKRRQDNRLQKGETIKLLSALVPVEKEKKTEGTRDREVERTSDEKGFSIFNGSNLIASLLRFHLVHVCHR